MKKNNKLFLQLTKTFFLLILFFCMANAYSQNFSEWIAASNPGNWSNNANWTSGTGYGQLEFKGNGSISSINDLGTISQWRLYFDGGQFYGLSGDKVELLDFNGQSSWILSDSSAGQNISLDVCFCDNGTRPAWITARGSGGFSFQNDVEIAGNVTSLSIAKYNGGQVSFIGIISGNNKDVFIGRDDQFNLAPNSGNVSFRNINTYTGNTFIDAGTLFLSNNGSLPTSDVFISSSTSLFLSNNANSTVLSVQERGPGNGGRIAIAAGSTLNINDPVGTRFQNRIDGDGDLNKNGPGTLSLYGSQNFFNGNITINDGILASSSQLGASTITINNGGRFDATTATNTIPQASSVTVNSGGVIRFLSDQTLDDLEVSGTLFVDTGVTLTIENSLTTNTAIIEGGGDIILADDAVWTNTGGITNIASGTSVTLKSSSGSTAQIGNSAGNIVGDITTERFLSARRAFRLLSSSVTTSTSINVNWQEGVNNTGTNFPADNQDPNPGFGTHITGSTSGANGFDATPSGNASLFTYNINQSWNAIPNTLTNTLNVNEGYTIFVRGDRGTDLTINGATPSTTTLRATGELQTGLVTLPTVDLAQGDSQFNLIANPYQAVVDFKSVTKTGLINFIYVWDVNLGGPTGNGGYATVPLGMPSMGTANEFIQPGQSFFVENDTDPLTDTEITFNEADKAVNEPQVSIFNTNTDFYIHSKLYKSDDFLNNESHSDAIAVIFNNDYTTIANDEDATKFSNPDENFAIVNNGLRSIDLQALPDDGHDIELSLENYTATNYSLTFDIENKPANTTVYLIDSYLDTETELTSSTVYEFAVDSNIPASEASDRFNIVFENTTLSIDDNNFGSDFSLYPNPTNDGLFSIKTNGLSGQDVNVKINNLLGQQVLDVSATVEVHGNIDINASKLTTGLYFVELTHQNQSFTSKLIIE